MPEMNSHDERLELTNRFRAAIDLPAFDPTLRNDQFRDVLDQAHVLEELYDGSAGPSIRSSVDMTEYQTDWAKAPAAAILRVDFAEMTKGRPRDVIRIELRNGGTSLATVHVLVRADNEKLGEWREIGTGAATRAELTEAIVAMLPVYNATRAANAAGREAMEKAIAG